MSAAAVSCLTARGGAFLTGGARCRDTRQAHDGVADANGSSPGVGVRRRGAATGPVAILNYPPPEPKRKKTWQEQLEGVKTTESFKAGRKNRGPRRTIKPHISQQKSGETGTEAGPTSVNGSLNGGAPQAGPAHSRPDCLRLL